MGLIGLCGMGNLEIQTVMLSKARNRLTREIHGDAILRLRYAATQNDVTVNSFVIPTEGRNRVSMSRPNRSEEARDEGGSTGTGFFATLRMTGWSIQNDRMECSE